MSQIPLQCEVCNQRFSGPVPAQQHFDSQKHKKKIQNSLQQQFSNTYCQVCNISCDTIQILRNHEASPRHLAMVEKRNQLMGGAQGCFTEVPSELAMGKPESVNYSQGDKEYVFDGSRGYCYLCSLELTSESHATSHLNGKNHAKKRHQKELREGTMNGGEMFCTSQENLHMTSSEFCELCRVPFSGPESARQHYASENHKKKERQNQQRSVVEDTVYRKDVHSAPNHSPNNNCHKPSLFDRDSKIYQAVSASTTQHDLSNKMCELCQVFFSGPDNAKQHFASEKHKKKVSQSNIYQNAETLACELCNVQFTCSDNKRDHLASSKHKKKVELKRREESGSLLPLLCKICDCSFTGQENAEAHFSSDKHKRNLHNTGIQQIQNISKLLTVSEETKKPNPNIQNTDKQNQGLFVDLDKKVDKHVGQELNSYRSHESEEFNDTFLPKPLNNVESSDEMESYEENFIAKPLTAHNDVQQVNSQPSSVVNNLAMPADDSQLHNQMRLLNMKSIDDIEGFQQDTIISRLANNYNNDGDFESIGERKIREETQTSLRPCLSEMLKSHTGVFNSAISDSGTVYDEGPPRFIQNNLYSGFLGRGRGLVKASNLAAVKRSGDYNTSLHGLEGGQTKFHQSRVNEDDETKLKRFLSNITGNENDTAGDTDEQEANEDHKGQRNFEQYQVLQYATKSKAKSDSVERSKNQNIIQYDTDVQNGTKNSELKNKTITNNSPQMKNTIINGTTQLRYGSDWNDAQMIRPLDDICKTDRRASTDSNMSSALSEGSSKGPDSGGSWKGSVNQDEYRFSETIERGYCFVCSIELTSRNHMRQHTLGQKHMKARQVWRAGGALSDLPVSAYRCDICNIMLSGPEPRDQHLKSQKHLKKLQQLETSGSDFYCDICKVQCSGEASYQQHLVGSHHMKMCGGSITANCPVFDRTQWFDCEVCKCRLNTRQQLEIHKSSPRHLAKAQKLKSFGDDVINHIISQGDQVQKVENTNLYRQQMEENNFSLSGQQSLLEKFLSEPLFPDEYTTDGADDITPIDKASEPQAPVKTIIKPVVSDEPVPVFKRFASQCSEVSSGDDRSEVVSNEAENIKRGGGSDLAFATRPRSRKASTQVSSFGQCETKGAEESINPFAKTHTYYCHTCRVPMNTQESYEAHVKGKRHITKVSKEKAPDRQHLSSRKCSSSDIPKTKTVPRNYQVELFRKSIQEDTLCFLPTGTGKTLVSVLTLCHMLEEFPSKNVLFLVDKVLLVLQQSKYIKEQIDGKQFIRCDPESDGYRELTRRPLNIASVCMGQQSTNGIPMWKHDVVVVTAAFCKNLLDQGILKWTDFSLVIVDEAHHCEKSHPFNNLLQHYHSQVRSAQDRPKILGLTASPAGKSDLPKTVEMLKKLLTNMGHVVMSIVEEKQNLETLQAIQSNARMIVKVQSSVEDKRNSNIEIIRKLLLIYIVDCLNFLHHVSDIILCLDLAWIKSDSSQISFMEFEDNIDAVQASLGMLSSDKMEKVQFSLFTHHVQCMCMAYNSLLEGGILCALEEINSMETTDASFKFAKDIGLPCDELYTAFMNEGQNMLTGSETGSDMSHKTGSHIQSLMKELISVYEGNHSTDRKSMSLVLVKQRGTAHKLTTVLNSSREMSQQGLRTALVVGHGGGGAPDKGMSVNQQKRTLEDIKQHLYQVVIATSVAEEGVDWPECDCVISMYPPSTVTALVQMRGRARKKDSKFIILCESETEREKLEDIMKREKNMIEATKVIVLQQDSKEW